MPDTKTVHSACPWRRPLGQSIIIAVLASALAILLAHFQRLDGLDHRVGDWRIRQLARPGMATSQVVTIIVDQTSLTEAQDLFGITWPWPREIYSYLLSFCRRANVKALAFDIVYTESSSYGEEDDRTFAAALADAPPALLALPVGRQMGTATTWPQDIPALASITNLPPQIYNIWHQQTAAFPVPALGTAAQLLGNVVVSPDTDAVFRQVEPFAIFDDHLVPGLGLGTYLASDPKQSITYARGTIVAGDTTIPLSPDGRVRLRYRGPSQTHRAFNATAILQSELQIAEGSPPLIDPATLENTYVLVGLTAPGLMDLKPTPMGRTYPGVEVHATALDNLLSGDFYRDAPPLSIALFTFILSLGAALAVRKTQRVTFSALSLPLFIGIPIGLAYILDPANIWLPVGQPMTAATLAVLAAILLNYATEGRQKRFIKGAFKQYLSPDVIEKLLQNPDGLALGGEEKELSILFSDVQGFTSISEHLTPTQLTALLNEYLTAMTDIILAAGGTIDKYEGDAIIAFWNAPLQQPDHATLAVKAALDCQRKLAEMRPDLKTRYGKEIFARIGINTGTVVVGNMGSNQRFDYTFLGDAGNLAARLEGINKQFGTFLLISEHTRKFLPSEIPLREIARVRVVGKATPVTIYEPLPQPTQTDAFDAARQCLQHGDFQQAAQRFDQIAAGDQAAASYSARCKAYLQQPPEAWDGTINLTEK